MPPTEEPLAEERPDTAAEKSASAEEWPIASLPSDGAHTDAIVLPDSTVPPIVNLTETRPSLDHLVKCSVADFALYGGIGITY